VRQMVSVFCLVLINFLIISVFGLGEGFSACCFGLFFLPANLQGVGGSDDAKSRMGKSVAKGVA